MQVYLSGEIHSDWRSQLADACAALGKPVVVLHPEGLRHALKEVDAAAMAVAETPRQVAEILRYVVAGQGADTG